MRKIYLLILLISLGFSSFSQTASIGKVYAKPGETITVPVIASDIKNAGAIGLYIKYDESVLDYLGVNNLNTNLNTMLYNSSESIFRSGWYSPNAITPVDLSNQKLFEVKFLYKGGNTVLSFDKDVSIIADIDGNNITNAATYVDGFVNALTATGISEDANSSFYNLYPNPTSGLLNISLNDNRNVKSFKVFNVDGREVMNMNNVKKSNFTIDLSKQPAGVYFLRVETDKDTSYKKVIKE